MVNSLSLGLIMLGMSVLIVAWAWWQSVNRSEVRARRKEAQRQVTGHIGDSITNVFTVKSFANERYEMERHEKLSTKLFNIRMKDWMDVATDGSNRHAALLGIQVLFVLYLVYVTSNNAGMLGVSIFAFSYSVMMTNRLFQINSIIRTMEEGLVEAAPMTEYLAESTEINDAPNAKDINVHEARIELQDVSFRYGDDPDGSGIFNGFSLEVKAGERIGLVGPSGGGKSTLVKLLLRFEDPTGGTIKLDDQDITKVTQKSLRQSIGYVPQEPLLFHRTIAENITYGNPSADISTLREAARKAHALEFIDSLPNGFDTIVGERGVKLSGGQRQRIAIARAILKNAPVLVLDEATSALDSESEKYIQTALHELMKNKTTIVIAHRLSTINQLDRIIVIDEGQVVEEGTHNALLKNNGLYARLWAHQSGGFIDE
jgi:ATP-binding cassette subfamily B protein